MKEKIIKIISRYKSIYNLIILIYCLPRTIYYYLFLLLFSIFKINDKKIIIISYFGKWYWDNGKYICNELLKYDYEIYRATKKWYESTLPKKICYVKYNSIKYLYHLATAKIWINNSRFPYGIRKREKQFYIQTWHGCIWFKKSEADAEKSLSKYYILCAKNDSKVANLFISNSDFCTNYYKKYYWYNGDILEYWCPRNDIIINKNKDVIGKVRKCFWFSEIDKLCLYAPTFRENNELNVYNINYEILLNELKNKFNGKWKLLIRLHPNISHLGNKLSENDENIVNASNYPDMQELLVAADFLITDYSSCVFDYAISKKPAIIYASDIEEYKKDRNFAIKFEESPFPIAINNTELRDIIKKYSIDKYREILNKFYEAKWLKETGKSCKKIVEIINEVSRKK